MGIESFWGSTLDGILRRSPSMSDAARHRTAGWMRLSADKASTRLADACFVVVDTETSGLDTRKDTLLSIGACVVSGGKVHIARDFYREIRQDHVSDRDNILLHGIGGEAQLAGEQQAEALSSFLEFAGKHPLVAFNASFDHQFLAAAMRKYLGARFRPQWVDLALLPKAMFPADAAGRHTLDDWLERFSIVLLERHNALADAYCTAQLLLVMLDKAGREGYSNVRGLLRAQRNYHWQRR